MLQFSMQLKILIFAIPFLAIVILHFMPAKKKKEEDKSDFSEEDKTEKNKID